MPRRSSFGPWIGDIDVWHRIVSDEISADGLITLTGGVGEQCCRSSAELSQGMITVAQLGGLIGSSGM